MKASRSALLALVLGSSSALGAALAPNLAESLQHAAQIQTGTRTGGKGGRKSVARKLRNWWKPTRTVSSKRRDPSDPRQAVLIAAAHAKRERRAVKLTRDYARCTGGAFA